MGNTQDCTFIVEFVKERLKLVKSFISFHLHTAPAWYFCPMKTKSGFSIITINNSRWDTYEQRLRMYNIINNN